ncbi:MAG: glutathione S-transferase family protein [Pseudomonadales bacterium]
MYTLYFLPDACSLATQVVLHELQQPVALINKQQVEDFNTINPTGAVPVLLDGETVKTEGAAILLHLLQKHSNSLFPVSAQGQAQAVQDIMFANATVHPAYSRLFFIAQHIQDEGAKAQAFNSAASEIARLWQIVEQRLASQHFLGGEHPSAADILLAVYVRWGSAFPVEIAIGPNTQRMLDAIHARHSFKQALSNEQAHR